MENYNEVKEFLHAIQCIADGGTCTRTLTKYDAFSFIEIALTDEFSTIEVKTDGFDKITGLRKYRITYNRY